MKQNRHSFMTFVCCLMAFASLAGTGAALASDKAKAPAPTKKQTHDYNFCLNLVLNQPKDALDYAQSWMAEVPPTELAARHCLALSYAALGRNKDAAMTFSEVAVGMESAPKEARAEAFAQAADAWLIAGDTKRARVAIDQALALDPTAEYLYARAGIRAMNKDWDGVRLDTTEILAQEPSAPDALTLRATAMRNMNHVPAALADSERAVEIAPHHLGALLERGRDKAASMDLVGARKDWQSVVDVGTTMGRADDPRVKEAKAFLKADGK